MPWLKTKGWQATGMAELEVCSPNLIESQYLQSRSITELDQFWVVFFLKKKAGVWEVYLGVYCLMCVIHDHSKQSWLAKQCGFYTLFFRQNVFQLHPGEIHGWNLIFSPSFEFGKFLWTKPPWLWVPAVNFQGFHWFRAPVVGLGFPGVPMGPHGLQVQQQLPKKAPRRPSPWNQRQEAEGVGVSSIGPSLYIFLNIICRLLYS